MKLILALLCLTIPFGYNNSQLSSVGDLKIEVNCDDQVDPFTVCAAVASAATSYADSKKKDKKLKDILDALSKFDARFDEVIERINQLGIQVKKDISDNYKLSVKNELMARISTIDTYVQYPGGTDLKNSKTEFEVVTTILMNQVNDPAFFGVIGAAMVTHHDIFYLRRKTKNNKEQAKFNFSKYHQYFNATVTYLDSLIKVKQPGKPRLGNIKVGFLNPNPGYKGYIVFSFDVEYWGIGQLEGFKVTHDYHLTNFKNDHREVGEGPKDQLPWVRFDKELFYKRGICEDVFLNTLYEIPFRYSANHFERFAQARWANYITCVEKNKQDLWSLVALRDSAKQLALIASRWAENPYSDTEHLKKVKKCRLFKSKQ